MATLTALDVELQSQYATNLPELALPWQAREVARPEVVVVNERLAQELGLDPDVLRSPTGASFLVGNSVPPSARPVAQGYAGHQFGGYSPRLGDGRALLLGELRTPNGSLRDLHLKGSGRTPFSRGGDGLAAIGPMLREYVISEAMHALGIPTTLSLAVVGTNTLVERETTLPGAVLARIAASHLRVGTFEYASRSGDKELLFRLVRHALLRHYPAAAEAKNPALALLENVIAAQASLVAQWMLVGFVHGVMNTDNMTISGETIDYGPCAFLDAHDPSTVFSSIDHQGRYAYGNQPLVAQWNLARLAEALLPLLDKREKKAVDLAVTALESFPHLYSSAWQKGMQAKLGLSATPEDALGSLTSDLVVLLEKGAPDHTLFFRRLADTARGNPALVQGVFPDSPALGQWSQRWLTLGPDPDLMDRTNPVYIPRNHQVEEALRAATRGDMTPFAKLLEVVGAPYKERPDWGDYALPSPQGALPYQTFCGT